VGSFNHVSYNNVWTQFTKQEYWIFTISNQLFFIINRGPEGTCFEGGVFPAKLIFPSDYPLSPPKMSFTCDMFHPNSEYNLYVNIGSFRNYDSFKKLLVDIFKCIT